MEGAIYSTVKIVIHQLARIYEHWDVEGGDYCTSCNVNTFVLRSKQLNRSRKGVIVFRNMLRSPYRCQPVRRYKFVDATMSRFYWFPRQVEKASHWFAVQWLARTAWYPCQNWETLTLCHCDISRQAPVEGLEWHILIRWSCYLQACCTKLSRRE